MNMSEEMNLNIFLLTLKKESISKIIMKLVNLKKEGND